MFASEMSKNKNLSKMIEQMTKENPSFPYDQKRMKIFRDGYINWQHMNSRRNIVSRDKVDQISNYSRDRLEKLQKAIETGKKMLNDTSEVANQKK